MGANVVDGEERRWGEAEAILRGEARRRSAPVALQFAGAEPKHADASERRRPGG
jgi:hypothetical protein